MRVEYIERVMIDDRGASIRERWIPTEVRDPAMLHTQDPLCGSLCFRPVWRVGPPPSIDDQVAAVAAEAAALEGDDA